MSYNNQNNNNNNNQNYHSIPSNQIDSNLQFYSSSSSSSNQLNLNSNSSSNSFYSNRPSLDPGRNEVAGSIGSNLNFGLQHNNNNINNNNNNNSNNNINSSSFTGQNWWNAFTPWTGLDNEIPLLEELGINFDHILQKSLTVLNPLKSIDSNIMDDADLAGPLVFCFIFATLLLVSGKPQFSYIYGVALVGSTSIYFLLNLMSESGIDAYRTASVLGYCLLPLVLLSTLSVIVSLDGTTGYLLSVLTIAWCSYSASSIFSSVLRLSSQRFLVAYPVGLFFAAFALLSVFDGKTGGISTSIKS